MKTIIMKHDNETYTGTILKHVATISKWANGTFELNMVMWDKPINTEHITYDFRFWESETKYHGGGQQFSKYELENFARAYETIKDISFDI